MSEFMSKQANDDPVPVNTAFDLGYYGVAAVNPDHIIVCLSCVWVVRLPDRLYANSSAVMMTFTLRGSHLLQPAGKKPGGEELLVGDLTALFIHEL